MDKIYLKLPNFLKLLLSKMGIGKESYKKINSLEIKTDHKYVDKVILLTDLIKESPKEGVIVECGVANGGSLIILNKLSKKKIFAFDSFEGFPNQQFEKDHENISQVIKSRKWHYKLMTIDLVKKNLLNNGISKEEIENKIIFRKGYFPLSFKNFNEEISFLHLDVDLYQAHKDCLEFFFPKLKKGGIVTFDDYEINQIQSLKKGYNWRGAKIAIDEFVEKNNLKLENHYTGFKYIIKN